MKRRGTRCVVVLFFVVCACILAGTPLGYGKKHAARAEEKESVVLTVVMYHGILNSRTGTYIVSEKQLDADLYAYKAAGYTAVFPSEIIAYAYGEGTLPLKPLLITFDDGHYNNMYYGLPLLEKHDMKAVINIIGAFTAHSSDSGDHSNPNYAHLTWDEIGELKKSGRIEIGNHTYNMHNYQPRYGIGKKAGESDWAYREAVKNDVGKLQDMLTLKSGVTPTVFAYPFGKYTEEGKQELISMGFRMLFTCNEGVIRVIKGDPSCLYAVRRINRAGGYGTQEFIAKMEKYRVKKSNEEKQTATER